MRIRSEISSTRQRRYNNSLIPFTMIDTRFRTVTTANPSKDGSLSTTTSSSLFVSEGNDCTEMNTRRRQVHKGIVSQQDALRNKRRKRKRKRNDGDKESFLYLFVRVAIVVTCVGCTTYNMYQRLFPVNIAINVNDSNTDDDDATNWNIPNDRNENDKTRPNTMDDAQNHSRHGESESTMDAIPVLPIWNLSTYASQYDAYAWAEKYNDYRTTRNTTRILPVSQPIHTLFWQAAAGLRSQFAELYGGENAARALLDRAISTFGPYTTTTTDVHKTNLPDDLHVTACRIWWAKKKSPPSVFRFAFGGYSVTAGHGNLLEQSFPLVMKRQLQTVFSLLGMELIVQNAAM
jgi:hypothetical protein